MPLCTIQRIVFAMLLCMHGVLLASSWVFNNPYPANESLQKIYYSSFTEQPKTLDPAKAYSSNEYLFIMQIYEPVLQYDYLARPYKLIPLTATQMPEVHYYDKLGHAVDDPINHEVATSVYTIHIKPGIRYQPHPAFAKVKSGSDAYVSCHNRQVNHSADVPDDCDRIHAYYPLLPHFIDDYHINTLADFKHTGTRELVADDYIYQIKRLANPHVSSPIYGLMCQYMLGFREFANQLPAQNTMPGYIDLRHYSLAGLRKVDDYTFEITILGEYPQFMFWLAMPFFAPVPWEVDRFYAQPQMENKNLGFGWYPIGTGPFMLTKNNPNSHMVLDKNPNYRIEYFPTDGSVLDKKKGYLQHAGERLPMIDRAIYTLEKESIPRWSKFLQGYYDLSGISADSFDQAIHVTSSGETTLNRSLSDKGMRLEKSPEMASYYLGFNMLDPLVGGRSERARKLRQAISIAINYDEYIAIFFNGRGFAAQGPIPPGIFGYHEGGAGINPYVYTWDGHAKKRRSIDDARALMTAAGYRQGRDPATGHALILHYDVTTTGGPDDKAEMDWMRKQFALIGIELDVRATQYNRFQEKIRIGNAQLFKWSWSADYPDPENFLFLLYGANGKVMHGGENAANYQNPNYDRLFDLMKNRGNDSTRQHLLDQMVEILRHDAPWVWGMDSEAFALSQQWVSPMKHSDFSWSTLKYVAIDVSMRSKLRQQWNHSILWPIGLFLLMIGLSLLPFVFAYRKTQRAHARRISL